MFKGRAYDPLKRALDVVVAAVALVLVSPIIGATAILVKHKMGSPVFFRQERPGRNGKIFTLLKFRSMKEVTEARGLVSNEDRMTPFGRALRSTSLDELPSLLNVLRGDMSLVGPRPLMVGYLDIYTPEQARRHEVRPGITGLAQVSGRNAIPWEQKFRLDVEYVDSRSALLDLEILIKTFARVFSREGVESAESVVGAPFLGAERSVR